HILCSFSVAKAKSKSILVQMVSAAGTGYAFNAKRNRLRDKMVMRKHDPVETLFLKERQFFVSEDNIK
uniref:Large ribosomal subunit protein bL33m n=1 Tax=Amphiprion ocellaris TaxID=80972 RepID=A0A3Q1BC75_AMPOC